MNHGDELLLAIFDAPADDTPRLAYADWCEETGGEARAEFIRVQVELAMSSSRPPECTNAPRPFGDCKDPNCPRLAWENRLTELKRREREFLAQTKLVAGWFSLPGLPYFQIANVVGAHTDEAGDPAYTTRETWGWGVGDRFILGEPRRGFVPELACACEDFLARAAEIFGAQPVERVVLRDKRPYWHGRSHCWFKQSRSRPSPAVPESAVLPDDLFGQLSPRGKRLSPHATPELALAALSDVCVRFGRAAAKRAAAAAV